MDSRTSVNSYNELSAVIFPPCSSCGKPYRPSKPVDPFTLMFRSEDWIANLLFKIERLSQRLRKRRMRKV